jgi:hypothetical protein
MKKQEGGSGRSSYLSAVSSNIAGCSELCEADLGLGDEMSAYKRESTSWCRVGSEVSNLFHTNGRSLSRALTCGTGGC